MKTTLKDKPEPEKKEIKFDTELTLEEFLEKCIILNKKGNSAYLRHKELFPFHKSLKKREKTDYHAPATREKCPLCDEIVQSHKEIMELQKSVFNLTGIPLEPLISAIKITLGTLQLKKNSDIKKINR